MNDIKTVYLDSNGNLHTSKSGAAKANHLRHEGRGQVSVVRIFIEGVAALRSLTRWG